MQESVDKVAGVMESGFDGEPPSQLIVAAQRIAAAALADMMDDTLHKALAIAEAIANYDAGLKPVLTDNI